MKKVTKEEFYKHIGDMPDIEIQLSDKYPYTGTWAHTITRKPVGKIIPVKVDQSTDIPESSDPPGYVNEYYV